MFNTVWVVLLKSLFQKKILIYFTIWNSIYIMIYC